jgi:DNA-binding response OmpR family regulator
MGPRGHDLLPLPGGSGDNSRDILTVLFIDPDLTAAERIARPLRATCAVAVVPTAQAAMAAMRVRIPNLVVMELALPDMNGIELIANLHSAPITHKVLIMVVTRRSGVRDKVAAFQAGADHYLVKPVDPAQFLIQVRLILRFRSVVQGG